MQHPPPAAGRPSLAGPPGGRLGWPGDHDIPNGALSTGKEDLVMNEWVQKKWPHWH